MWGWGKISYENLKRTHQGKGTICAWLQQSYEFLCNRHPGQSQWKTEWGRYFLSQHCQCVSLEDRRTTNS